VQFSNLLGTVYRTGNLVYTNDGTCLLSPGGNRVSVFDLVNNKSYTLPSAHSICEYRSHLSTLLRPPHRWDRRRSKSMVFFSLL
jgi:hypothetical protein